MKTAGKEDEYIGLSLGQREIDRRVHNRIVKMIGRTDYEIEGDISDCYVRYVIVDNTKIVLKLQYGVHRNIHGTPQNIRGWTMVIDFFEVG